MKQSLLKKGKPSNQPKGYRHSPEVIARLKIINKEIVSRPEVKAKMAAAMLGKRNTKKHIAVYMVDPKTDCIIIKFDCLMDACKYFGKPRSSNITTVLQGKRDFAFGYKWRRAS